MKLLLPTILVAGLLSISLAGIVSAYSGLDSYDSMLDPDKDGLTNVEEFNAGTDPGNPDTDNDGLPDGWEYDYGLDPADGSDAYNDDDYFGGEEYSWYIYVEHRYTNYDEYYRVWRVSESGMVYYQHTNPMNADTDGDGYLDPDDQRPVSHCNCQKNGIGCEYPSDDTYEYREPVEDDCPHAKDEPNKQKPGIDTDGDGLFDSFEIASGTDINNPDTDGDGLMDGQEVRLGLDPNDWDTDNDLLADGSERGVLKSSTDGHLIDTDSDGIL